MTDRRQSDSRSSLHLSSTLSPNSFLSPSTVVGAKYQLADSPLPFTGSFASVDYSTSSTASIDPSNTLLNLGLDEDPIPRSAVTPSSADTFLRPDLPRTSATAHKTRNVSDVPTAAPWSSVLVTGQSPMTDLTRSQGRVSIYLQKPPSDSGLGSSLHSTPVVRTRPPMSSPDQGSQYLGSESPELRLQQAFPEQRSRPLPGSDSSEPEALQCTICNSPFSTRSEYAKHMSRHDKKFRCTYPGCSRKDGFATPNDLDRHEKGVHQKIDIDDNVWKCFVPGCKSSTKIWPRQDNFKAHVDRMHKGSDVEDYVRISDEWLENEEKPRRRREAAQLEQGAAPPYSPLSAPLNTSVGVFGQYSGAVSERYTLSHADPLEYARSAAGDYAKQDSRDGFAYSINPNSSQFLQVPSHMSTIQPRHGSYVNSIDVSTNFSNNPNSSVSNVTNPGAHESTLPPAILAHQNEFMQDFLNEGMTSEARPLVAPKPRTVPDSNRINKPFSHDWMADTFTSPLAETNPILPVLDTSDLLFMGPQAGDYQSSVVTSAPGIDSLSHDIGFPVDTDPGSSEVKHSRDSHDQLDHVRMDLAEVVKKNINEIAGGDSELARKLENLCREHASSRSRSNFDLAMGSTVSLTDSQSLHVQKPFSCNECGKHFAKKNVCAKHEKRHARAFFCTMDGCYKRFGTKGDMQRHEFHCKQQKVTWRCWTRAGSRARNKECCEFYDNQQEFETHRRNHHSMKAALDDYKIAADFQGAFWCGFCNMVVDNPVPGGVDGSKRVKFRYEHIENHIKEGKTMAEWHELRGLGKTKKEMQDDREDSEDEEDSTSPPPLRKLSNQQPGPYSQGRQSHPMPLSSTGSSGTKRRSLAELSPTGAQSSHKMPRLSSTHSAGNIGHTSGQPVSYIGQGLSRPPPTLRRADNVVAFIRCCRCQPNRPRPFDGALTCPNTNCFHPACRSCLYFRGDMTRVLPRQ